MSTTIGKRMHKLKKLLAIRLGPGAALLPKEVKSITMRFAPHIEDGHRGPKKFFKTMLPRLQYRNPAVRIKVDRSAAQSDPAVMNIIFTGGDSSSSPSPATPAAAAAEAASELSSSAAAAAAATATARTVTINMKFKTESEILQQLYEATGAQEVEATDMEKEELRELAEREELSRQDSMRQAAVNRQRRREAELLKAARGGIALPPNADLA